jgi:cell fate regulator YaaT (PSP1 superfamily)
MTQETHVVSEAQSEPQQFMAVRFRGALPKAYRWDGSVPDAGTQMIVERVGGGEELVTVVGPHSGDEGDVPHALATATPERIDLLARRQDFEAKAFAFARQRVRARRMSVKFVRCSIGDDRKVRLFYASEKNDDLRDLMRDFAHEFGAEVELVHLAERSAAGKLGGLGPCGRPTCCSTFLKTFPSPSTKMAKDQGISLTPQKLSGRCGKLKCCLAYEADTYREYLEQVALRVGHTVRSPKGYAKVIDLNVLLRRVRVATLMGRDVASFAADEVERVLGGVPEGDVKGGFFYGPDGPPQQPRRERAERHPKPARSGRSEQSKGSQPPSTRQAQQASGTDGEASKDKTNPPRKKRRRRRSRRPKSND